MFVIACLHEGFTHVKVFAFNNSIGLGIIWRNHDVMDDIFLKQVSSCSHQCRAIVGKKFSHSTPSAEDIKPLTVFSFPSKEGATQARKTRHSGTGQDTEIY